MVQMRKTHLKIINLLKLLWTHRMGRGGLIILILFLSLALFAPLLRTVDPSRSGEVMNILQPPSRQFWFGTDDLARDIWSQVLYGSRISLMVGFLAGALSIFIGSSIGMLAGYYGGRVEEILMRIVDFFMMMPPLPLMIVLAAVLGPSIWNIIVVVSIVNWPSTARVVRSQVLSLKERAFIESARCIGAGDGYLLFREILPNVIPIIFAQAILMVTWSIYSEAILSFLGLGDPLRITWGVMLNFAFTSGAMSYAPWWVIPPIACIVSLILGFTFFGTAVSDVTKPGYRERLGI
jgi:ABC-type dipeptide/oligopeptide/nickel transport system permease subunit